MGPPLVPNQMGQPVNVHKLSLTFPGFWQPVAEAEPDQHPATKVHEKRQHALPLARPLFSVLPVIQPELVPEYDGDAGG